MIEERDREGAVGTIDVYDLDHSLTRSSVAVCSCPTCMMCGGGLIVLCLESRARRKQGIQSSYTSTAQTYNGAVLDVYHYVC